MASHIERRKFLATLGGAAIASGITRAAVLRDLAIPTGVGHLAAIQAVAPSRWTCVMPTGRSEHVL